MTQRELQDKLDDISDSCCGCGTAPKIMVLINQHVAEVIGEDVPHGDEIGFIDPATGISSRDRVKIWNECKADMRKTAGL